MEKRSFRFELRAEGDGRTVAGYAAVFDELSQVLWDQFKEKIDRGAFASSLGGDIRALWNHNTDLVIGRTKAGTLRLAEDTHGLRVEIDMPESRADLVEAIRRGDVDQMSFAFDALEDTWDKAADGMMIRTLRKVQLYEVSPVTFPAYTQTSIAMRGNALGDKPAIPAQFRRADTGDDAERAQGRTAARRRRLALLDIESQEK